MIKKIMLVLILGVSLVWAIDLNLRVLNLDCDISHNAEFPDIEFYKGETVQINYAIKHGREAVQIPTDAYPVFRAWTDGNTDTMLIGPVTGTVVNSTQGRVRIALTPAQSGISNTTYEANCQVYDADGSNMGVIWRGDLVVRYAF